MTRPDTLWPRDTGRPQVTRGNGPAVAALVCGLAGFWILWIVLSPLAVVLGALGWQRANAGAGLRAMSKAAVVLGVVGIALYLALWPAPLSAYVS